MEIILLLVSVIIGCGLFAIKKCFPKFNVRIVVKILAVIYFSIGIFRLFLPDDFLLVINGAYDYGIFFNETDYLSSFLRWGYQTSLILLPVVAFFDRKTNLLRVVTFYCLPFLVANIICYDTYIEYFTSREVLNIRYHDTFNFGSLSDTFREVQFSLELVFATSIAIYLSFNKEIYRFSLKGIGMYFLVLIPIIILSIPVYLPQSLYGYGNLKLTGFTLQNYVWIIIMFVIIYALYLILRFQSYENRYLTCLIMSVALFVLYNSFYITGVTIPRLPIQLCNLACYLMLIAIVFKIKPLFDFTLIANIVGTIIAILVPDVNYGIFSFFHFHFLYEHMMVLIIPISMMVLRVFPRPNLKSLRNALIGFAIYFVFCWCVGTYLNSISSKTGYKVNYFYIFEDDIIQVFGFLAPLRKVSITLGDYVGYPLFQFIVFLGFCGFCVAFYYAMKWLIKVGDDHFFLRKINIEEKEELTGVKSRRKTSYDEEVINNVKD